MIASRAEYSAYLRSMPWQIKRRNKINADGDWINRDLGLVRCTCGRTVVVEDVRVHHLHYRTLGEERYSDLQIACVECHDGLDDARHEKQGG